jgi:hypothetical protein
MSDEVIKSVKIVRAIIRDIYGRYGLEQEFRSTHPKNLVGMYETWIEATAEILGEPYEKFDVEKKHMVDIVNRIPNYFKEDE